MLELGKIQKLKVVKKVDFGCYLADPDESGLTAPQGKSAGSGRETSGRDGKDAEKVLLPKSQMSEDTAVGDELEVFLYKDSKDRLIATVRKPALTLGEVGKLKVASVTRIGAFLEWGLEKELFLPFHEQTYKVQPGDEALVYVYIDKSDRLCGSMKVYHHLMSESPYQMGDTVEGTLYEISDNFGAFVAVDDKYSGLIPKREFVKNIPVGSHINARVVEVRGDGKLTLAVREKAYLQMEDDAEEVLRVIESYDGVLPFTDKASPETIRREMNMSKNEFKRAVGRLLKEGKVEITETSIRLL